jgi:hypothetical protein
VQVDDLRRQLETLKSAETESRLHDELRTAKRELTTAELRVMTLTSEVDEMQAHKERSTREFDQAMRVQDRANHDLSANLKTLTSELDSNRLHVHRLQVRRLQWCCFHRARSDHVLPGSRVGLLVFFCHRLWGCVCRRS